MMDKPIIQIREFHDGTWSVIARVWTPQKKFYEHPTLINLTKEDACDECVLIILDQLTNDYIVNNWTFIGD